MGFFGVRFQFIFGSLPCLACQDKCQSVSDHVALGATVSPGNNLQEVLVFKAPKWTTFTRYGTERGPEYELNLCNHTVYKLARKIQ